MNLDEFTLAKYKFIDGSRHKFTKVYVSREGETLVRKDVPAVRHRQKIVDKVGEEGLSSIVYHAINTYGSQYLTWQKMFTNDMTYSVFHNTISRIRKGFDFTPRLIPLQQHEIKDFFGNPISLQISPRDPLKGKRRKFTVSRLIWSTFVGFTHKKYRFKVKHKNNDVTDNRLDNLYLSNELAANTIGKWKPTEGYQDDWSSYL